MSTPERLGAALTWAVKGSPDKGVLGLLRTLSGIHPLIASRRILFSKKHGNGGSDKRKLTIRKSKNG
jgi:hypothetical protein